MTMQPFHIMAKPAGASCNLRCAYCFYLDKIDLYAESAPRMDDETLEAFVRSYFEAFPGPHISFAWQGGEPTLMGLDFFERVVELQQKWCPSGWQVENSLQTNGVLLDDAWAAFLAREDFLIGLSWDGPPHIHDLHRGAGTCEVVRSAWELLQRHGVRTNVLTVVHSGTAQEPKTVYDYLRGAGVEHMQFIPLIRFDDGGQVTDDSVVGLDYGRFLIGVWKQWIEQDVGKVFVQTFEAALSSLAGMPASLCVFSKTCGSNLIIEHNGDIYPCDHFVEADRVLGNIHNEGLDVMVTSSEQQAFGEQKHSDLAATCHECPVLTLCWGGCPKDRVDGESILCAGYKRFFEYTKDYHQYILQVLAEGKTAAEGVQPVIDSVVKQWKSAGRNDPCPCGSGRKYKRCCALLA